jgi:hypothetical protein
MHLSKTSQDRLARIRNRAIAERQAPLPPKVQAYLTGTPIAPEIASETPAEVPEGGERRRFGRVTLAANVLVRRLGGFNFEVAVKDISAGGCRVVLLEPCEAGDPVITRLPQIEPLGSRVRWARGTTTGLEFLTALHPAVFDCLLTRLVSTPT